MGNFIGSPLDPVARKSKEVLKEVMTDPDVVAAAKEIISDPRITSDVVEQLKLGVEQLKMAREQAIYQMKVSGEQIQRNSRYATVSIGFLSASGVLAAGVYIL